MKSALSSPPFHPPSECNLEVFTKMIDSIVSMNIYIAYPVLKFIKNNYATAFFEVKILRQNAQFVTFANAQQKCFIYTVSA